MTPVKTLDHTDSDKAKISVWNPPWKIIFICKKKKKPNKKQQQKQTPP